MNFGVHAWCDSTKENVSGCFFDSLHDRLKEGHQEPWKLSVQFCRRVTREYSINCNTAI